MTGRRRIAVAGMLVAGALSVGAPALGADPSPAESGGGAGGDGLVHDLRRSRRAGRVRDAGGRLRGGAPRDRRRAHPHRGPGRLPRALRARLRRRHAGRRGAPQLPSLSHRSRNRGVLEPLGPYLRRELIVRGATSTPQAIDAFDWRASSMCIPQNISSLVVYYDKDLFDAAGSPVPGRDWTWDDFLATAQALTKDLDGDGTTDQYGLGTDGVAHPRRAVHLAERRRAGVTDRTARRSVSRSTRAPPARRSSGSSSSRPSTTSSPTRPPRTAQDSESRFMNGTHRDVPPEPSPTPTFREITAFDWDVAPLPRTRRRPASSTRTATACPPRRGEQGRRLDLHRVRQLRGGPGRSIATTGRTVPSLTAVAESPAFLDPTRSPPAARSGSTRSRPSRPSRHGRLARGRGDRGRGARACLLRRPSVDEAIAESIQRTTPFFTGGD